MEPDEDCYHPGLQERVIEGVVYVYCPDCGYTDSWIEDLDEEEEE